MRRICARSLAGACEVELLADRALVALQGPRADAALARFAPEVSAMRFMDANPIDIVGTPCLVSRSGYTGEDGFEISIAAERAEAFCEALLRGRERRHGWARGPRHAAARGGAVPLRLRPRYAKRRRSKRRWSGRSPGAPRGGARAGGFPGATRILDSSLNGAPRRRVGLGRKAGRRCAPTRRCSATKPALPGSALSPRVASARASMRRSRWGMCRHRARSRGRCSLPRSAASGCRSRSARCRS